jgi:hypothetical protein
VNRPAFVAFSPLAPGVQGFDDAPNLADSLGVHADDGIRRNAFPKLQNSGSRPGQSRELT